MAPLAAGRLTQIGARRRPTRETCGGSADLLREEVERYRYSAASALPHRHFGIGPASFPAWTGWPRRGSRHPIPDVTACLAAFVPSRVCSEPRLSRAPMTKRLNAAPLSLTPLHATKNRHPANLVSARTRPIAADQRLLDTKMRAGIGPGFVVIVGSWIGIPPNK